MEWDDLKHFLAVARRGSLSAAAKELKSSAATVGRRVGELERRLGARLFDRRPAGYFLTEDGEAIRVKAEQIESAIISVQRATLGRDLRPTGKVRVAASDDVATCVIAPNLHAFQTRCPDISLELIAQYDLVNLARFEADIAIRGVRPREKDLVARRVGSWDCALYAARSYAAEHDLKVGSVDFSKVDIITWTDGTAHLRGGPWFKEHARSARVALKSNSRRVQHAACEAGLGLAILPCLIADKQRELVCVLPHEKVLSVELWLVVHRDLVRSARIRATMDFLAETAASYRDRAQGLPPRQKANIAPIRAHR
jgi:DNA-binding transcriptional LysR family regulator